MNLELLKDAEIEKNGESFTIDHIEFSDIHNTYVARTTHDQSFLVTEAEVQHWINLLSVSKDAPVPTQEVTIVNTEAVVYYAKTTFDNMGGINKIMEDTIKKIQEDPAYVPQAHAINQTVMTMLEAAKTQVDIIKLMKG